MSGFEFVTYERRPYPLLSSAAFTDELVIDGETIGLAESREKNLRNGRGRVRRIALRMSDGRQVNLLAVSKEPAAAPRRDHDRTLGAGKRLQARQRALGDQPARRPQGRSLPARDDHPQPCTTSRSIRRCGSPVIARERRVACSQGSTKTTLAESASSVT